MNTHEQKQENNTAQTNSNTYSPSFLAIILLRLSLFLLAFQEFGTSHNLYSSVSIIVLETEVILLGFGTWRDECDKL